MQTSYRVPLVELKSIPAGSNQSQTYRHLLSLAMRGNCEPEAVDISALPTTMIRLPPAAKAQLDAVAHRHGMDYKAAFAGLCTAGAEIMRKQMHQHAGLEKQPAANLPPSFTPKSDNQRRYYELMMVGLSANRIVFAEGSTGIGKSRAMAAAAVEQARAKKTPIVIAAPTVAVMKHLYDELRTLDTTGTSFKVLPGASEFVDDLLLNDYLQAAAAADADPDIVVDEAVREWVSGGAKPRQTNSPIAHALGDRAAWLMDDFRQIASNMPVEDFVLRRGDLTVTSESRQLLAELKNTAKAADIIICTHAMLALGQYTHWGAVPEPCVLFIDEAHQFEQAVSSINSDQLSLYSLRASLANLRRATSAPRNSVLGKALKEARLLTSALQDIDTDGKRVCLTRSEQLQNNDRERLTIQLRTLGGYLASDTLAQARGIERYRSAVRLILASLTGSSNDRVDLDFSPDRRYPSLYCGPASVGEHLRRIWKTAKGGVVLASATLYIMDSSGNSKCDYLRGILAVDFKRLNTPAPVIDKSIYTLPTLFRPSKHRSSGLIRPRITADRTQEEWNRLLAEWHSSLADAVHHVINTAHGGTLVLLTAYRDIIALSVLLKAAGLAEERIIAQQPDQKFSEAERRYRLSHSAGVRPILLGLGTAWTGIDLKDDTASDETDSLLTDLVIARLPIGLNRSNSMNDRVERMGLYPIINEALLTLKQGVGRLIRRDQVKHRRLWVLDGRIVDDYKGKEMENLLSASARRFLREYRHREEF
ncbi:hypothetical protein D5045_00835 [Verminephrobacter eiseniae]|uniref:helicase C-terminal domain-containing protein n=1 Tax=Verminephrobacter eiseniae TaxID=364317 RepID=UPI002237A357|nr:helicase C-terminal domain-containing protein [Verminephrobacter eiseniae]MCW5258894.1 hypothetical protein [Verminephrobacter eiseniae]